MTTMMMIMMKMMISRDENVHRHTRIIHRQGTGVADDSSMREETATRRKSGVAENPGNPDFFPIHSAKSKRDRRYRDTHTRAPLYTGTLCW